MLTTKTTLNIYNVNHILTKKTTTQNQQKNISNKKNICIIEKFFVILHPKLVCIGGAMSSMRYFWCLYH